jgi:RHS repeat-associated protein
MEASGKHLPQGNPLNPDGSLKNSLTFNTAAALARDFQYDKDGSITSKSDGSSAYGYNYVGGSHKLDHVSPDLPNRSTSSPGNFQYDELGRMTQDVGRGTNLRYGVANMPVEIDADGKSFHLFYDANNYRVASLEETTPGNVLAKDVYVYEAGLKVVKEFVHRESGHPNGAIDIQKNHHYGQGGLVAVSYSGESQKHILLKDHQGSVMGVVSTSGNMAREQGYLPYGEIEKRVLPGSEHVPSEGWTGKEFDDKLKLYYFGARFFDPELGMWLGPDPAGQFFNPYSYGGDGLNYVDPNGEFIFAAIAIGAGLALATKLVSDAVSRGDDWHKFNRSFDSSRDWAELGKTAIIGGVSGAFTAGLGSLGTTLGTNIFYSTLGSISSYGATGWLSGGYSTEGFLAAGLGGALGGFLPTYGGLNNLSGGALASNAAVSIGGEIAYGSARGALTQGVIRGTISGIRGEGFGNGFVQGAKQGAISGLVGTSVGIAYGGYLYNTGYEGILGKEFGDYNSLYNPGFRQGGALGLVNSLTGTFGVTDQLTGKVNINTGANSARDLIDNKGTLHTLAHEFSHVNDPYQQGLFPAISGYLKTPWQYENRADRIANEIVNKY